MNDFNNQLDQAINSERIRLFKCILPYLDKDLQKQVAIFLKFFELVNTIKFYNNDEYLAIPKEGDWKKALLIEMSQNVDPDKSQFLDMILKITELLSALSSQNSQDLEMDEINYSYPNMNEINSQHSNMNYAKNLQNSNNFYPNSLHSKEVTQNIPYPSNQSTDSNDIIKNVAPLLDEKQLQMLQSLATILS
ncbi:MAG: hypothetical protein ATN31_10670 [Candidatus Epulonipiscioides saccharophilum]|nr:MAG: hypothetical protein ATN31_10670 [Epulopiscium sp. AS2M-Bin001]